MTSAPGAQAPTPGIGDNSAPFGIDPLLIEERLKADYEKLVARAMEIDEAAEFRLPETIENDEQAGKMAEFAVQCRRTLTALKTAAAEAELPYLRPVEVVRAFWARFAAGVTSANTRANTKIIAWDGVKRARIQAQAWRPAAGECLVRFALGDGPIGATALELQHLRHLRLVDADNKETPLGKSEREAYLRTRDEQRRAQEARRAAAPAQQEAPPPEPMPPPAPPAPMAIPAASMTSRSERGATASVRTTWKPVVINAALVPREYCEPVQAKLNAKMKLMDKDADGKPTETIPGVEWQSTSSVTARG